MRKFSRFTGIILIVMMAMGLAATVASAETWEFGTSGKGKNPFTPRGYLVDTEKVSTGSAARLTIAVRW